MRKKLVSIAIGGNSLIKNKEQKKVEDLHLPRKSSKRLRSAAGALTLCREDGR